MKGNGNVLLYFVCFGSGAAIGAGAAWYLTKQKCEGRTNEEIESVRAALEKRWEKKFEDFKSENNVSAEENKEQPEDSVKDGDVAKKKEPVVKKPDIPKVDYRSYYENVPSENKHSMEPEMIDESEYGENTEYRKIEIIHTADGYLLDEDGEPIDDESGIVGYTSEEIEDQFIEAGEDTIYIRNDDRECYYEVLRSERFYDEGEF